MKNRFVIAGILVTLVFFLFQDSFSTTSDRPPAPEGDSKVKIPISKEPRIPPPKTIKNFKQKNRQKPASRTLDLTKEPIAKEKNDLQPKVERPDEMVYSTDPEGIDGAMKVFLPNIRNCYQVALNHEPELKGRVTFSFQISENDDPENLDIAKISNVEIFDTEVDSGEMENCIMDNIDELWFEPHQGDPIHVRYPFVFSH